MSIMFFSVSFLHGFKVLLLGKFITSYQLQLMKKRKDISKIPKKRKCLYVINFQAKGWFLLPQKENSFQKRPGLPIKIYEKIFFRDLRRPFFTLDSTATAVRVEAFRLLYREWMQGYLTQGRSQLQHYCELQRHIPTKISASLK